LALEQENIESPPIWKPVQMQPVFKGCQVRGRKVSEDLFKQGLCLPSGNQMTEEIPKVKWPKRRQGSMAESIFQPTFHFQPDISTERDTRSQRPKK